MIVTLTDVAQACRCVTIASFLICMALVPLNVAGFFKRRAVAPSRKAKALRVVGAVGFQLVALGILVGAYTRYDQEFTWNLPIIAVGSVISAVYMFCVGDGCDPKAAMDEEDRRLERLVR